MSRRDMMTTSSAGSARPRITLVLASLGFFLITLDILIVNVALTDVGRDLGGTTTDLQWVIDGYTLPFAALLLFAGTLSDRIGAKATFVWGIVLFGTASIACSIAPTIDILIAARVAQGGAAALMLPASMALIREAFPDAAARAQALGIWAVGGAIAGGVGPLLGGALTSLDWRFVFIINIPVCAAMLILARFIAPSTRRPARFDWAGQSLSIVALATLIWGLIEGGAIGFSNPLVVGSLTVAALSVAAFILRQKHADTPMMPLSLFRPSGMRIAVVIGTTFMIGWYGTVFVISIFLQQELGLTPLIAGLAFLPSSILSIFGNALSGTLVNRFGARVPIMIGLSLMVIGLIGLALTAELRSPVLVALLVGLIGPGGSIAMPSTTAVVLESAPAALSGTASAVFNTFRQIGGAIAIAVFGSLIAGPAGITSGAQTSLFIAAATIIIALVLCIRLPSPHPAKRL